MLLDEDHVARTVVRRITERVAGRASAPGGQPLEEVLTETLIDEQGRLELAHSPRAEADRAFYARVRRELSRSDASARMALLAEVVSHYTAEIRGHFDPRVYSFATRALPVGLTALLNGLSPARMLASRHELPDLAEHVHIEGEVATLKALARRGTVVLVPTHSSNLDSLLLGFSIFRMGLPPFAYGAGLNLFSNPLTGFFMNHLGAYTVDRDKTDPLYRETLKEFTVTLLELGQHNLFFPGGTRSRSGALEAHLKKGLLGTGVTALRRNLECGRKKPRIFFVPATATYPLVLEAQSLVTDFLVKSGKSRYMPPVDEFDRVRRWVDFLSGLLRMDLRVQLVVGKPLDPFGNDVDADGLSHDPRGRPVDPSRYLLVSGAIAEDEARDAEYTRILAARILTSYRADTVALPSTVLAFAVLQLLRRRWPRLDIYRLLREVGPDTTLELTDVLEEVTGVVRELRDLEASGSIRVSPDVRDAPSVVQLGLRTFGTYHATAVLERTDQQLRIGDANLLFFYQGRLDGYGLRGAKPMLPQRSDA